MCSGFFLGERLAPRPQQQLPDVPSRRWVLTRRAAAACHHEQVVVKTNCPPKKGPFHFHIWRPPVTAAQAVNVSLFCAIAVFFPCTFKSVSCFTTVSFDFNLARQLDRQDFGSEAPICIFFKTACV